MTTELRMEDKSFSFPVIAKTMIREMLWQILKKATRGPPACSNAIGPPEIRLEDTSSQPPLSSERTRKANCVKTKGSCCDARNLLSKVPKITNNVQLRKKVVATLFNSCRESFL